MSPATPAKPAWPLTAPSSRRLSERMFYTVERGRRVPRGALSRGAEQGQGDGVRVVPEPVHGLCPPLHVLLRPGVRAAGRPALPRTGRPLDPGEDERRRRPPEGACPPVLGGRHGGGGSRDRPVPARRGQVPADARLHPG